MLSTENPSPDLSYEISQLKDSSSDERASDNIKNDDNQVDLLKPGLDDNHPIPKFSIRDYVFNTRGKDIKNNWPFSQKNLQLCLKYGVKDLLPPFQSLDSVRNPSDSRCGVENISYSGVKLYELSDDSVGQKLAVDIGKINSSGSQEDKEFPSTTTSQSCSDTNSAPQLKHPISEPAAEYLPKSPNKKSEIALQPSKKVERNIQNPVKKCKLIVKLNNIAEPVPNESLISETMASKICPVCKTFSSSSNTTLNAHIDQCLSEESTPKWTANSKMIKHRIKPRKTKLMVDIYETAIQCTLEDLDRRNGTNWASNLGFPAQDSLETSDEEMNKKHPSVSMLDINEQGGVYVDSNGTKLRILSKLSDLPSNSSDCGPSKIVKRDRGNKLLSSKKKKYLVHKHKLLKSSLYGKGSYCPKPDEPEVNNGQQNEFHTQGYEEELTRTIIADDPKKSDDVGMIKQWVGSKRTGLKKKINLGYENDEDPHKIIKNLRGKSGMSSSSDNILKGNIPSKSSDENPPPLPHENLKRKEYLLKPQHTRDRKNQLLLSNFSAKKPREYPPNGVENHTSSRNNKKMRINKDPSVICSGTPQYNKFSSGGKEFTSLRRTSLDHAISSRSKKVLSLRKKLSSVRCASVPKLKNNNLEFKNYTSGSDEEAVVSRSSVNIQVRENAAAQMQKPLINMSGVLKIRKKRAGFVKSIEKSLESDQTHGAGKNFDSFPGDKEDEFACAPTYKIADGEAFIALTKSLDSSFPGPSNIECVPQHYSKAYEEHHPDDLGLSVEEDIFCAQKVDTNCEPQRNYFVDVDPIPIPGPPGSFLPSPGRMGSEELHGNSSLTTCRIQSSEDGHELVDMDSSDSPISAISAVSNSVAARSVQSPPWHEIQYNSISDDRTDTAVERELNDEFKKSQPCCCSRKDGSLQSSGSFRRSVSVLSQEKQMADENAAKSVAKDPASTPVLRLMGKNLMVVNKDENLSPQMGPNQSNVVIKPSCGPRLRVENCPSTWNETHSFNHSSSRGPSIFDNMQKDMHFDFNSSGGFKIPSTVIGGNFSSSLQYHEYADQLGSGIRSDAQTTFDVKNFPTPVPKHREVIVIDDSPECEAGFSIQATRSRLVNPFHHSYPPCTGYPIVQDGNAQALPSSKGTTEKLSKWNYNPDGSSELHLNSLYYSPGFF